MSPERINSGRYSYKADVWALGIILYELTFGKLPFQSSKSICENDYPIPIDFIDQDIQQLLELLLRKDDSQRSSFYSLTKNLILRNYIDPILDQGVLKEIITPNESHFSPILSEDMLDQAQMRATEKFIDISGSILNRNATTVPPNGAGKRLTEIANPQTRKTFTQQLSAEELFTQKLLKSASNDTKKLKKRYNLPNGEMTLEFIILDSQSQVYFAGDANQKTIFAITIKPKYKIVSIDLEHCPLKACINES
ncbi:hypothetical protein FGO68_gene8971 [Halteria grandinella]|uniref:Protein kinase domain-containing protein n=1 Tax=Halteria grandinella TaxID=5974 RepID=A0A8J8T561_HALGN|nr:hypothetical protein FGO68_gene8971 [Halteria grandinella]